jgi:CRP-like cAMP-binding protein
VPFESQSLLAGLAPGAVGALRAASAPVELAAGQVVFREGDPPDAVYLVASGRVSAQLGRPDGGQAQRLQGMGPGMAFGELALFDERPRSADVVAEGPATVWRIPVAALPEVEAAHPGVTTTLLRNVARLLSSRLRRATDHIRLLDA